MRQGSTAIISNHWQWFAKDVLWGTLRRALWYGVCSASAFSVFAYLVFQGLVPAGQPMAVQVIEACLLAGIYLIGGGIVGSLLGICTVERHIGAVADAIYQTVRATVFSVPKINVEGSVSTEAIRQAMNSPIAARLKGLSQELGAARFLYNWLAAKPLQLLEASMVRDFLPTLTGSTVQQSTVDEFIRSRLAPLVASRLKANTRILRLLAWLLAISVLFVSIVVLALVRLALAPRV
jgi:hypothetical protein